MHDAEVRNDRIVHVLPEQRFVVKGVERYSVRSGCVSKALFSCRDALEVLQLQQI